MKESNILRLKIIMKSNDYNSCLYSLNLDNNAFFLLLINIIEDAVINYNPINNYEYLIKVNSYLKTSYEKLSKSKKCNYYHLITKLKKLYKKEMGLIDFCDQEYFRNTSMTLNEILTKKKEKIVSNFPDDYLYKLVYETIFSFKNLEYLDILIEKDISIVNIKKERPIFLDIIDAYIKSLKEKDKKSSSYYLRVINKFLDDSIFELDNEKRESVLNTLNDFLGYKTSLTKRDLEDLKNIISKLKRQYVLNNYNINLDEYQMNSLEMDVLDHYEDMLENRIYLDDYIITIDDLDSTVLDDGISIKKLKNGNIMFKVHIADPLGMYSYNSSVINDAKLRTTTIYDINPPSQMLPSILSSNKLSLLKNKKRLAKSFCFEFNKEYGIVDFKVLNTVISVSNRHTYNEINELYKKGGTTREETEMLELYDEVLKFLKNMYKNVKIYEELKRENIIGNRQGTSSFAESLISYLMMITGYKTAEMFHNLGYPFAYRCHIIDEKWQSMLDEYIKNPKDMRQKKMLMDIKSRFPKAFYTRFNQGHRGLGVSYHSHTTSPLRRFCDILNLFCLDTCYFRRPTDKQIYLLEKEIDTTCDYINMQSNSIDEYLSKIKVKK